MNNLQKYNNVFVDTFEVDPKDLETLRFKESELWDSVGHMMLVAALEDAFEVMLEPEDMMSIDYYTKGKEVLARYGVEI